MRSWAVKGIVGGAGVAAGCCLGGSLGAALRRGLEWRVEREWGFDFGLGFFDLPILLGGRGGG